MKQPTYRDFEVEKSDAAITVTFKPTKSRYVFYRLADPKDIARYGPVLSQPDQIHHGGPTRDTGDYSSDAVISVAHDLATRGSSG